MAKKKAGFFAAAVCVAGIVGLGSSTAFAGEITGNGKVLTTSPHTLHGRSICAFSGQEDLQFLDEEGNPLAEPHKGDPSHAQSWGQIPKDVRDFLTTIGSNPGVACNPTKSAGEP